MSGIAGIIHFDGRPVEAGQVEAMTAAMHYRGPDGINHWRKGKVALGQCMLRTTPESLEETQPLTNEDESLVLVMDGRVDNWEELRKELLGRGAVLRTRADAELVLRAYEVWGKECLAHIDGDFALVIWDARGQIAFCARDRMGNKPFHYHWSGSTLVFASELHPILALPWMAEVPNEGMLAEFLAAEWYSRDETLWTGIMRLVAAHCMEVGVAGLQSTQYWEPDLWATLPYTKDEEYIEHYRALLFDSVRRLSRSHKPVAIEVSGGLDSSAVFCVAEHLRRAGRLPAPGIEGYTLAFTDDSDANEVVYARAVGDFLGVRVNEVAPSIMPLKWYEARARASKNYPCFPNETMHLGLMGEASQRGSRVLLNGVGGDQWLGGNLTYYEEEFAQCHWRALFDCFRSDSSVFGTRQAWYWFMRHSIFPLIPAALQMIIRQRLRKEHDNGSHPADWLSSKLRLNILVRREQFRSPQIQQVRCAGQPRLLEHLSSPVLNSALEEMDGLSAGAHVSLELRHPLHTPAMAQYAFSTPERIRLRGGVNKYHHRRALQGILPQAVLDRIGKAEFSILFRRHLDEMQESLTAIPRARPRWIESAGMARLIRAYHEGSPPYAAMRILWCIHSCDKVLPSG